MKTSLSIAALTIIAMTITACSKSPSAPLPIDIPKTILTLESSRVAVFPGGSISLKGQISSSAGTLDDVRINFEGDTDDLDFRVDNSRLVSETERIFEFTLSADPNAITGKRPLNVVAKNAKSVASNTVPLDVDVLSSGFMIQPAIGSDTIPVNVYPGDVVDIPVTVTSIMKFTGKIDLNITGLPEGITSQSKSVDLVGNSVSTNLVLIVGENTPIIQNTITVNAQSGDIKTQRPVSILVLPHSIKLPNDTPISGLNARNVDKGGNLWLGSSGGFVKITPSLIISTINSRPPLCGTVSMGEDGGIWSDEEPFLRLNPNTEKTESYLSPRGFSGCGVRQIDANGRDWETYFGVSRLESHRPKIGEGFRYRQCKWQADR